MSAAKRKLTRAERKQIAAAIARAKSANKFSAQATIPYLEMYPDGICHVTGKTYSKAVRFDDLTYRLAQPETKDRIFSDYATSITLSIHRYIFRFPV